MEDRTRIFAHRGLWGEGLAPNSSDSIRAALRLGFSVETDLRDFGGRVVVSHDPVQRGEQPIDLGALRELKSRNGAIFALNIKSDGLVPLMGKREPREFFFDMSTPEVLKYSKADLPLALRISDLEEQSQPSGVQGEWLWIDSFQGDWFLQSSFSPREQVGAVLVSPELHGRDPSAAWDWLARLWSEIPNLCVCTDLPKEFLGKLRQ